MKFLSLFLIVLATTGTAQPTALWATLKEEVADLRGRSIRLGDVADVQGTDEMLVASARRIVLAEQSAEGRTRLISRETVETLWARKAGDRYQFRVVGAPQSRVHAATTKLTSSELEVLAHRHLAAHLRGQRGNPRIKNVRAEGVLHALCGRFSSRFDVRFREEGPARSGMIEIDVLAMADGVESARTIVKAEVHREGKVVVARRNIGAGRTIKLDDLELVERTLDTTNSGLVYREEMVVGMVARTRIPKGRALQTSQIRSAPVVFNRDVVVVEVRVGNMKIEGQGRALEEGAVGDTIKVRMEPSKKAITAEVVDSRRVRLKQN